MDEETRARFLASLGLRPTTTQQQLRGQGAIRTAAGIADIFAGRSAQKAAEEQIGELASEQEDLAQQFKDLSAPSLTDANTIAAATRNAAILGGVPQQQDQSAELAAAKMAMESGADPATVQRQLAAAQQAEQQAAAAQQQQAFQQGLGMAQTDAQNRFAQQQQGLMMDMDANAAALEAAQRESLMAQQRKQRGIQGAVTGATQFAQNFDSSLGGEDAGFLKTLGANIFNRQEQGGTVQKTPGEFDHDTNDMILMAQTEGGLVDTGIRQTGGEFVLNPEQAEGLEGAYDNVDKKSPTYDQLLALYKAARFLEEPQFDDDYEA